MTLSEYESIKQINPKNVIHKMKTAISWKDKNGHDYGNEAGMMAAACFILWNVRNDKRCRTLKGCYEYCGGEDMLVYFTIILEYLEEYGLWSQFVAAQEIFTDQELIAAVIFSDIEKDCENTPECLLSLVDELLNVKKGNVLAEYCANDCAYSLYKGLKDKNLKVTAYEDIYTSRSEAELKREMLGIDNVTICGQVEDPVMYDRLFVNFGDWETISYIAALEYEKNADTVWKGLPGEPTYMRDICIAAIISLKKNGRAVMMMRAGQLSGREDENVRRFLVEQKWVSAVIALTDKLYEETWVNTYILILEKGKKTIRFCDVRDRYKKSRSISGKQVNILTPDDIEMIMESYKSGEDSCKDVTIEEVRDNDYVLLPQRYTGTDAHQEKISIGDCISKINRGTTLSGKEIDMFMGKGSTKCITPMSLSDGIIAKTFSFDREGFGRKVNYSQKGDVLIRNTGNPIRVAVADDEYAVVGNIYILRFDPEHMPVSPYYIKCFLESPKGQEELLKYVVGESAPVLTVANLNKVRIPVFEKKKQAKMEKRAEDYTKILQNTIYELDEFKKMFE